MSYKFKKITKRNMSISLAALLLVIVVGIYAQHRSRLENPIVPSTDPLASTQKSAASGSNNANQQAQNTNEPSQNTTAQSGPPPLTPYGNFVSNHHPGGNTPTAEASTCNTSAGAVCLLQFTNGSQIKKLDPRTTNANGAAIWYWDVKTAGLSAGSWTITAIATLNGQTKTADDVQPLVVQ
jgi:hypothetical protein